MNGKGSGFVVGGRVLASISRGWGAGNAGCQPLNQPKSPQNRYIYTGNR